jgi:Tfp pilus assembly protein PilX
MKQQGYILIVSLAFLVLMTLLGLSMFGGFITNQSIATNMQQKAYATDAAQSALNAAEYWLASQLGTPTSGAPCSGGYGATTTPVVCSNSLSSQTNPSQWPWNVAGTVTYTTTPPSFFYIQYLGMSGTQACPIAYIYLITTGAQASNANAVAILQSVYGIKLQTINTGC